MIEELQQFGEVIPNADMKNHTTMHVGGNCKYLILPDNISKLQELIKYLEHHNSKYFILGNGSNIIFNDNLEDLIIVKLSNLKAIEINKKNNILYAEAGAMLPKVVMSAVANEMTGLEFAAGIPGTVGGSIYGNAGAYNSCILDYVKSVTILNNRYELEIIEHEDITYGYRTSMFKNKDIGIIVAVKFYLKNGDKENSLKMIEDRKLRRLESQPLSNYSAGSVFRNPVGDSAWKLIDACGLTGKKNGGAEVSTKHANFVINTGNATGKEVYDLIHEIHDIVLEKTNVDLIAEQEFIGWE